MYVLFLSFKHSLNINIIILILLTKETGEPVCPKLWSSQVPELESKLRSFLFQIPADSKTCCGFRRGNLETCCLEVNSDCMILDKLFYFSVSSFPHP